MKREGVGETHAICRLEFQVWGRHFSKPFRQYPLLTLLDATLGACGVVRAGLRVIFRTAGVRKKARPASLFGLGDGGEANADDRDHQKS